MTLRMNKAAFEYSLITPKEIANAKVSPVSWDVLYAGVQSLGMIKGISLYLLFCVLLPEIHPVFNYGVPAAVVMGDAIHDGWERLNIANARKQISDEEYSRRLRNKEIFDLVAADYIQKKPWWGRLTQSFFESGAVAKKVYQRIFGEFNDFAADLPHSYDYPIKIVFVAAIRAGVQFSEDNMQEIVSAMDKKDFEKAMSLLTKEQRDYVYSLDVPRPSAASSYTL